MPYKSALSLRNDPIKKQAVIVDYSKGYSINELSAKYKVNRVTITRLLTKVRVSLRTRSEVTAARWKNPQYRTRVSKAMRVYWKNLTPQEREDWTSNQRQARVYAPHSFDTKIKIAQTIEQRVAKSTPTEKQLIKFLRKRKLKLILQKAIGPYNCDIAINNIAVEVNFSAVRNPLIARYAKKVKYFLDTNWHVLIINICPRFPLTEEIADYVTSYVKRLRRDPTMIRQYRVIWGAGQFITGGSANNDKISLKSAFAAGNSIFHKNQSIPWKT